MKYRILIALFCFVILAQAVIGYAIYANIHTWSERGTFGDMFGAINTLFSGLAFAGIIFTIFLQSKELELQRKELELTRQELNKSAEAQAEQVTQMLHAAKITAVSTKVQCYSSLMAGGRNLHDKGSSREQLSRALDELDEITKNV